MKSAGAAYRSTSRTTLPAPGHRIPRTLKYLSGLVFRSDAAAGRYVVSVPDQQGYRPLGPGPCSPGRSESPARPTPRYRWYCCHPGRPECGQPHRRRHRLGHARIRPTLILHSKIAVTNLISGPFCVQLSSITGVPISSEKLHGRRLVPGAAVPTVVRRPVRGMRTARSAHHQGTMPPITGGSGRMPMIRSPLHDQRIVGDMRGWQLADHRLSVTVCLGEWK
jgi:hypothetical protein